MVNVQRMSEKNISKLISLYYYTYFKKRLKKVKICKMSNNLATHKQIHSGPENLKSPGQKTREIKSISRNFLLTKFHFLYFQKWPKINFWTRKKFKTAKNAISRKTFFDLFDFTSFFWMDFFKFSGPLCNMKSSVL